MGENLARSNLFIIITSLLQMFTFSIVPGEKPPTPLDFTDGVTASVNPFKAVVSLRT